MSRLLVTGGTGQLARALADLTPSFATAGYDLHRVGRPDFDFDRPDTIETSFAAASPDLVVNAAAWTAVDLAETEPEAAARANDSGPARLGALCARYGIPYIHISTDYVFDGAKGAPYTETDPTCPTGVYGATKRAGEEKILVGGGRPIILRTAWVYAAEGKNFVRTMLGAAQKTSKLRVVADQRGTPTNAADLAAAILGVAARLHEGWEDAYAGIFHATGSGETTWHGLALAIFEDAARHGRPMPEVAPIATADWPTPAKRPADSRLDCRKLETVFGVRLPPWRESLSRTVDTIIGTAEVSRHSRA